MMFTYRSVAVYPRIVRVNGLLACIPVTMDLTETLSKDRCTNKVKYLQVFENIFH